MFNLYCMIILDHYRSGILLVVYVFNTFMIVFLSYARAPQSLSPCPSVCITLSGGATLPATKRTLNRPKRLVCELWSCGLTKHGRGTVCVCVNLRVKIQWKCGLCVAFVPRLYHGVTYFSEETRLYQWEVSLELKGLRVLWCDFESYSCASKSHTIKNIYPLFCCILWVSRQKMSKCQNVSLPNLS